jgi:general secretion pathway protein G
MMKKKSTRKKENGFTLIELLIVIVILGLLVGLVGPRMFGKVGTAKLKTAQAQIGLFSTACDTFRLDMGRFPKSLDELVKTTDDKKWDGPYLPKRIPPDSWDNPYEYKSPGDNGRDYDIISYGADGTSGGKGENQDICSWKSLGEEDSEDEE